jgi:hypothetical protein
MIDIKKVREAFNKIIDGYEFLDLCEDCSHNYSKEDIDMVKQALTELERLQKKEVAPTLQEVIHHLYECLLDDIEYVESTKDFFMRTKHGRQWITENYGDGNYRIIIELPPNMITLIGRFYEGLGK